MPMSVQEIDSAAPSGRNRVAQTTVWALLLMSLLWLQPASALIEIEITEGGEGAVPIAVVPFGWTGSGNAPEDIAGIVTADLARSGYFSVLNRNDLVSKPVSGDIPAYATWRAIGIDYLLIGGMSPTARGYNIDFQLFDTVQQKLLSAFRFPVSDQTLRSAAHQIADITFEEVLGLKGAFNTQVAYVSVEGSLGNRVYELQLADADGHNPQAMLRSGRPIMSPAWAPDGYRIAYVSFENARRSAIYVQDRRVGDRRKLVSEPGINGAPAWSPDGQRLAVTLSRDGNPEIYIVELNSGNLRRLTRNEAIDTEAVWLDDQTLIFTSDRSGGPQLYEMRLGESAKRLTFEGAYNASASVSPDGHSVAFVQGSEVGYRIGLLDRNSGYSQTLTSGTLDESPSFAPNGQMILFATEQGGRGALGAVSIDGTVEQRLSLDSGTVREPAWAPYAQP